MAVEQRWVLCANDYPEAVLTAIDEVQALQQLDAYVEDFMNKHRANYSAIKRSRNMVSLGSNGWSPIYFHLRHVPLWGQNPLQPF